MTAPEGRINVRLIAIAVLAVAILAALIVATGGGFPSQSSGNAPAPAPPATSTPAQSTKGTPRAATPSAVTPSGQIQGTVTEVARHVSGHTWEFLYTVRDTGAAPIAGFQLNGLRAHLYHVTTRAGWGYFGSGCAGNYPNVLIYWSTGSTNPTRLERHQAATFGFYAETTGTSKLGYSLSFGQAHPAFGTIAGPAASSLPAPSACGG